MGVDNNEEIVVEVDSERSDPSRPIPSSDVDESIQTQESRSHECMEGEILREQITISMWNAYCLNN